MASPLPGKESKIRFKSLRRGFNRVRDAILPDSRPHSPANIPNDDYISSTPSALLVIDSADKVGETPGVERSHSQDATPPTSQQISHPNTSTSHKIEKAWGMTRNGLMTALRLLEKSADAFPPLKSAVGGLVACLDLAQVVAGNHDEYEKLATDLTIMANTLAPYMTRLVTEDVSGSVARILESIKAELTHIGQQQDRSKTMRIVEANQDQGDVIQRYRRIESLFRQLQNDISLQIWEDTKKGRETSLLNNLSPVFDARYNSNYSMTVERRGCTAETRKNVLKGIQDWAEDPNGTRVYWMSGMAGTGKTTILYTLCEWLSKNQRLGGDYFCSRISSSCRDVNTIVPTLAYQIAQFSPAFRSTLCKVVEENPEASKLDVKWQFLKLLQAPMQAVKTSMPEGVVVVIDALDECDDGSAFRLFLETLLKLAVDLPIKFLVTSRPEPGIREKMLAPGYSRSVLHLHDIEESIVEGDINKYLTEALGAMSPPPPPKDIEWLAKRAGKLFIYAATTVRYITGGRGVNSNDRLRTVLGIDSRSRSTKQHNDLNKLYTSILSVAVDPERLEEQEVNDILLTLRTVVCAKEPMTVSTLASLLSVTEQQVRLSLEPLRSILHVQDGTHGLVSPFHASFPDYLFDKLRSGEFHCEATEHSEVLANFCFDLMKTELRFNICRLESSFVFDEDVLDLQDRIEKFISPALSYACRYWGDHLRQGNVTDHVNLVDFLSHRLLFWMEVLNLEQVMAIGPNMLRLIQMWLKESQVDIRKLVADAEAFISRFAAGACAHSTPHIYISGLPFCPRSSSVHENYWRRTRGLIDVRGSVMGQWPSAAIGIWETNSEVFSVAFSPDGTRIVSGSEDQTIRVWDASTGGAVAEPFEGHTNCVRSVAFSPDGTRIVSGSIDDTIRVWDARTGDTVAGPFEGHTDSVLSVAFSPDGTRIVSGSRDQTVLVWDARTDDTVARPFQGHTDSVMSVAFSPDGTRIVSGSRDYTIRVWDARTGDTVAEPFRGHTGMFSRSNHHQRRQQSSPPRPIRESLRSHSLKTAQLSTRKVNTNELVQETTKAIPAQHKKSLHTQTEAETTTRTRQHPLSPPETPGSGTPGPTNAHLQPAGIPAAAEDTCLLESLLESALAALVAIRSTPIPNQTPTLSKIAKNTLAELNRLANTATWPMPEADNGPNAQAPLRLNSQGVQTVRTYADITKTGQAKSKKTYTKRPPTTSPRHLLQRDHLNRHSPYRLIVRWPGHSIPTSGTALTQFIDNLEGDINPDFVYCKRPGTRRIAAANVTRSGNLVIHTKAPFTAAQLKLHTQDIHNNAKAIPGFSPPDDAPLAELDVPWHGLVIHGLPNLSLRDAYYTGEAFNDDMNIWDSLEEETGILRTDIRDLRILCREGEEERQSFLSLRIMVDDPAICDRLIRDGAFLFGTHCRVSQYRLRRTTPLLKTTSA